VNHGFQLVAEQQSPSLNRKQRSCSKLSTENGSQARPFAGALGNLRSMDLGTVVGSVQETLGTSQQLAFSGAGRPAVISDLFQRYCRVFQRSGCQDCIDCVASSTQTLIVSFGIRVCNLFFTKNRLTRPTDDHMFAEKGNQAVQNSVDILLSPQHWHGQPGLHMGLPRFLGRQMGGSD
jgi:hypothetical protein